MNDMHGDTNFTCNCCWSSNIASWNRWSRMYP